MNEISKSLKCVVLRNGIEIWREEERLNDLVQMLKGQKIGFIKIDNEIVNAADIIGIFSALTMEELNRRKNGQWKCQYGNWHGKNEKCFCKPLKKCRVCGKINPPSFINYNGIVCSDCWENENKN